jgi:hypothetical protein
VFGVPDADGAAQSGFMRQMIEAAGAERQYLAA